MKPIFYLIIGFLAIIALGALLKFAIGILFWVGLAVVIGGFFVAVARGWMEDRRLNAGPNAIHERQLDREADRALKDIEKKLKS